MLAVSPDVAVRRELIAEGGRLPGQEGRFGRRMVDGLPSDRLDLEELRLQMLGDELGRELINPRKIELRDEVQVMEL